ncbi:polysaccharide deacetylase family protein [Bacillus sp. FJAT-28004]|uniref:polysaccharide deacetylase family protein n=1 Tax=Bacillus sp. FJAT-28004 TaxID=1679165 RepID=UPI0006B5923A|nr:polysaccharide deacetylase family protein [Bacillus sp. FJAT-28004]
MRKLAICIILLIVTQLSACSSAPNHIQTTVNDLDVELETSLITVKQPSDIDSKNDKTIYLTFDDGPSSATNDILDTLKSFHAKATFFMLEPKMRQSPEIVKRIVEEGHAVALHGVTHNKNRFYRSEKSALDEMNQAQKTLEEITGISTVIIRTPYGSVPYLTDSYRKVLNDNGYKLWDWNVDSSDWSISSKDYIKTTINQIRKLEKYDVTPIVLMHDLPETAKHLTKLLTSLADDGYVPKIIEADMEPYNFNCYDRCRRVNANS